MTKQDQLRAILTDLGGGPRAIQRVCELLPVKGRPRAKSTVYKWLTTGPSGQDIPDDCLDLLKMRK